MDIFSIEFIYILYFMRKFTVSNVHQKCYIYHVVHGCCYRSQFVTWNHRQDGDKSDLSNLYKQI